VEASLAAGDLARATTAAGRLAELARLTGDPRAGAASATANGCLAAATGDVELAAAALEGALAQWAAIDLPYEAARARLELAAVLSSGEPDRAAEHAHRALAGFGALGAARDADRAAALLRSLGVVPRTGPKRVGVLTAREQEVLQLLGAGLSNPEIAQRLHVSRKTAAHHVSSILAKLHLRNRAEAAAFAVAGGHD
jgi:DNA-binding CsgD family transcriptional regulator